MKALLVLDMQQGSFVPEAPMHQVNEVIERINTLARYFRQQGDQVIFIQHDGTKEGDYLPNSEAWKLLPTLDIAADDLVLSKTANDAFYDTRLQEILQTQNVSELVVTGCFTDFCIDATVKSAHVKDYQVVVIGNAHTTCDKPGVTAEQLIDHYNGIWQWMAPTRSRIQVMDSDVYFT